MRNVYAQGKYQPVRATFLHLPVVRGDSSKRARLPVTPAQLPQAPVMFFLHS